MKISDLFALAARNLARRKGRTALTVIGVGGGHLSDYRDDQFRPGHEPGQRGDAGQLGDLTQIEVYGGGMTVAYSSGGVMIGGGSDEPAKLDDAMIEDFRKMDHVVTATPFYQPYSLNGTITAGQQRAVFHQRLPTRWASTPTRWPRWALPWPTATGSATPAAMAGM